MEKLPSLQKLEVLDELMADEEQEINAEPTKSFFVDMLVRDIALEQAILDLLDNCVDGAKRLSEGSGDFTDKNIRIAFSSDEFAIWDNCGGFSRSIARDYAFRFGRAAGARSTPHSIGQFGVGMKRALFKFGKWFRVDSATADEQWAVEVDVPVWELEDGWTFPWADTDSVNVSSDKPGTNIVVKKLRPAGLVHRTSKTRLLGLSNQSTANSYPKALMSVSMETVLMQPICHCCSLTRSSQVLMSLS